ncbi:ComF family protein [Paenibacillus sp. y28]|uniref:ComF family protein n=1 Tax=Paenibacillus sp. y28 TaxID=3129110 RepID=UPI0030174F4D
MKQLLALYKYRGDERKEQVLAQMVRYACSQLVGSAAGRHQVDYVTYVPLSPERLSERGFNQAERMAREVSRYCGAPVVSLLERTRHTGKQSYKSRSERLADMRSAFRLREDEWKRIANKHLERRLHIIVVDDVYTTGSTLNSCAKQITERLPADVYGITWAR